MTKLQSTLCVSAIGLMLTCSAAGCRKDKEPVVEPAPAAAAPSLRFLLRPHGEAVLVLEPGAFARTLSIAGEPDTIDGEKDGVRAVIDHHGAAVRVDKGAKEGKVELTIKDGAGNTVPLTVLVRKSLGGYTVITNTSFLFVRALRLDRDSIDVVQGGPAVMVKVTGGKAVSTSEAKDGLKAAVDGESIKLTAANDAKLGEQQLTVKGEGDDQKRLAVTVWAPTGDEDAAAEVLAKLGGRVLRDSLHANRITGVELHFTHFSDAGLKELKEFKNLKSLDLRGTHVTDAGLMELTEFKNLHTLDLSFTRVGDAGLRELRELKNLQKLGLDDTPVTDAGLKELKGLKNLVELNIGGAQVTDVGLKELSELKGLFALSLRHTRVTDVGLKELKELKGLQVLNLDQTKITDVGLKELKELASISDLYLDDTNVSDLGLKELSGLKRLQRLDLNRTRVTDAGLKELPDTQWLGRLEVYGAQVTDAGVKEFKAARPKVDVGH